MGSTHIDLPSLDNLVVDFDTVYPNEVHDKSHTRLVRDYLSEQITPNYKFNTKDLDLKSVRKMLLNLQKVPEAIRVLCNNFGGTVIIFDGKMTDNECMNNLKGKLAIDNPPMFWDDANGTYNYNSKTALIKRNSSPVLTVNLELHEYGHMLDRVLGKTINWKWDMERASSTADFLSNFIGYKQSGKAKGYCSKNSEEFFAETFALYHLSRKFRNKLGKKFPEIYYFFNKLEKIILSDYKKSLNKTK